MDEGTGKSASKKVITFTKTSKKWPWESKLGELHAQRTTPNLSLLQALKSDTVHYVTCFNKDNGIKNILLTQILKGNTCYLSHSGSRMHQIEVKCGEVERPFW